MMTIVEIVKDFPGERLADQLKLGKGQEMFPKGSLEGTGEMGIDGVHRGDNTNLERFDYYRYPRGWARREREAGPWAREVRPISILEHESGVVLLEGFVVTTGQPTNSRGLLDPTFSQRPPFLRS
jgi:hypothetical protein